MTLGKGRDHRDALLAKIAEADAGLAAELEALRGASPQAYRKRLRGLAERFGADPQRILHAPPLAGVARRAEPVEELDLTALLAGGVAEVKARLAEGLADADLAGLAQAERVGRERKGVLDAIAARAAALTGS